jgi:hypothetical protein
MITAALLAATLVSGVASRRFPHMLPHAIAEGGCFAVLGPCTNEQF